MGFFIEMRCEKRGEGRSTEDNRCESDDNGGPMDMADDTQSGVVSTISFFNSRSKESRMAEYSRYWLGLSCMPKTYD